ncbi:Wall-associated receptor kinase-like 20 [Citrus sinensis]|nr:Wall-associated receptor kinase-like 20 [Citrus sinensis]
MSPLLMFIVEIFSSYTICILALKSCTNCGHIPVPYPLSTGPGCGDQSYKVRCNAGTLWFDALNGSSYMITSINPLSQSLIIRPPGRIKNKCIAADYQGQGLQLDNNLRFNISSSNTVMVMNCSIEMLQKPFNCSSTSICHSYIRDNPYAVGLRLAGPLMNIGSEFVQKGDAESAGQKRCLCKAGFQWDPISGIGKSLKCSHGKGCKHKKPKTAVIGGLAAGAFLLGTVLATIKFYKHFHQSNREVSLTKVKKDISRANNSGRLARIFSSSGGFGEVFKAILDDGTITAVKRSKLGKTKGIDQILNEVRILCQLNHRSLVKLLGCCVEVEQPLLVYEVQSGNWPPLKWHHRLHIARQTAQAIAYLHLLATPPIYHRDIKSSNILLDEKLDAKISDFGLSRLALNDASHVTTFAQGTLGYLDPEYYINFQLTDKSDVYSFGVVLVELLTSKKAVDFNREEEDVNLVVYFGNILKQERLVDAIDPMLKEGASEIELDSMKAFGLLGAACLDERRQNRPSIKEVADEIERIIVTVSSGD